MNRSLDPQPQRSRIGRWFLLFAAVFAALGIAEVVMRIAFHNPYRRELPDHLIKLAMHHPNTDYTLDRAPVYGPGPAARLRTDSRSYILPSFQHPTPDLTIAFLGGSTTECTIVLEPKRFHALVSERFLAQGLKVNTLNIARSANTLQDSLNVFLNHVILDRPDVVVIMHAANDIGLLAEGDGYRPRMGRPVRVLDLIKWATQMGSRRSYLLAKIRQVASQSRPPRRLDQPRGRAASMEAPLEPYRQRLIAFVRMARSFGIAPVLMTQPLSTSFNEFTPSWADRDAQEMFNDTVRQVGVEEGVMVADLVRYLNENVENWNEPMRIFYDGMHVTDFGSERYAEHIVQQLGQNAEIGQLLKKRRSRRDGAGHQGASTVGGD